MFYVNNKQVLGLFLNGNNYNYMSFGFGKIIPENRNAPFAYINLAQRYLSQYRVEYGNIQSGYDNFPIARLDYPVNGIFHSPLTYYYGGNIVPTKNVPVYINNGYSAIRGTVYNDINVSGNIVYFAANTDFQGHNVNIHPENFRSTEPYFNGTVMDNCNNFILHSCSRLSKSSQVSLYDCNKFIGWFNFFRDDDGTRFPGFRGFLHTCRDGVFNFNLMNMHGGGSDGSVTNYYNFSCISNCNNIKLNINGSSWQAWVHPNCYSGNCNITTRYIVPGFDHMSHCNFDIYLPSNADVEKSAHYSILSNSYNCNVYFDGTHSNLYSFRNGEWGSFLFENLNNCNLNLLLHNSAGLDYGFVSRLNNCNIKFNNTNLLVIGSWLSNMNNCNITGSVVKADYSTIDLVAYSTNVSINVNASLTNNFSLLWNSSNINGDAILGKEAVIYHSNNLILNLYNGNNFRVQDVLDGKFRLDNINNVDINGAYDSRFNFNGTNARFTNVNNTYARVNNTTFNCHNTNNTEIYSDGGGTSVTGLDNCYNLTLSGLTFNTSALSDSCLLENVYNSNIGFGTANTYYRVWHVENCDIDGFPRSFAYVKKCIFRPFSLRTVGLYGGVVGTWNNMWPHRTRAGIRSMDNISNCRVEADVWNTDGSRTFNNVNNMQTSFGNYYNGTVTANLPNYNMEIKLNVDCNTLNLGVFQAGPPHGFVNSSISANSIYAKNTSAYYVQVSNGVRLYCENFCDVPFSVRGFGTNEPVMLINNYKTSNSSCRFFEGGLTRIGRLNFQGGAPIRLNLTNDACVFINNAVLNGADVDRSLLFVGSNVTWTNATNVTNKGVIANLANWGLAAHYLLTTRSLAWNVWDSGPWGAMSLLDYCKNV